MLANNWKGGFLLSLLLLLVVSGASAQSAAELKAKRNRLMKELASTTKTLNNTKAQKSAAMKSLNLLEQQIAQRRELITTLNQEITLTDNRIADNQDILHSLSLDLERMRAEYGETLRSAYRNQLTEGWLSFVFSADGVNDAFRRINYLRQYQAYRRRQGRLILATQESMRTRTESLEAQRLEKEELLVVASEQGSQLESALNTQMNLVDELTGAEKKLFARVKKKQDEQAALDRAIEKAIAEEIAARIANSNNNTLGSAPTNVAPLGGSFADQRGRLNWPAQGAVVKAFGRQPHPDVPSVTIYNGGVDLDTGGGARIQSVFSGEIISIRQIPGYRNTVMIRHGEFYTVYSNLDRVIVEVGDEVELGSTLGFTSRNGDPLHFELWKGKERQDPERWLRD